MKRPKRKIVRVEEVFHEVIGSRGIRDLVAKDRLHLSCGHWKDVPKRRSHTGSERCAICQGMKIGAFA